MKALVGLLVVVVPVVAHADKSLTKGATWNCKKDPIVSIPNGSGKFTFKGKCAAINVGGGKNTLTIESVDTLNVGGGMNKVKVTTADTLLVGGGDNTIAVDTVGTIDVGGAGNKITWKKAATGDAPALKGQPDKNTITQKK